MLKFLILDTCSISRKKCITYREKSTILLTSFLQYHAAGNWDAEKTELWIQNQRHLEPLWDHAHTSSTCGLQNPVDCPLATTWICSQSLFCNDTTQTYILYAWSLWKLYCLYITSLPHFQENNISDSLILTILSNAILTTGIIWHEIPNDDPKGKDLERDIYTLFQNTVEPG